MPPALSPDQAKVVSFGTGCLKVLGDPATGKTVVLVERAVRLIEADGVEPEGVLVFARDRHHAIDLRDRFVRRLQRSVGGPSIFTFHAFAWSLLTRGFPVETSTGVAADVGHELVGYAREPVLLTAFDQRALVKDLLENEDPADWPVNHDLLGSNAFAGEVRDFLLRAQERVETPESIRELARERGRDDWLELATFYKTYLDTLEDPDFFEDGRPRVDFALVLTEARRLLGEHPGVLDDLRALYPHVLVDDFEEANHAEADLLGALLPRGSDGRSAVVAGDPGGTVFSFRGANPACLDDLSADDVLHLSTSYRRASQPDVRLFSHLTEEARGVVAELRSAWASGMSWGGMAVIVRDYRNLLAPLRRELSRAGVPHRVEGEALRLSADPVVRPLLDLFTIACRRPGYEELWPSLLLSELGGFTTYDLIELRRAARLHDVSLHELCDGSTAIELGSSLATKVSSICDLVTSTCGWAERLTPDECFWKVWSSSRWFEELVESGDDRRLDSLTTLADALSRFTERRGPGARMQDFIETLLSAEFAPDSVRLDRADDAVTLVTAHASKGREFGFAVVAGCVEGLWPDPSRRGVLLDVDLLAGPQDPGERGKRALAEEQRLFRLATSRGRKLAITGQRAGGSDRTSAEPSRFLRTVVPELPAGNAEVPQLLLTPREAEITWRAKLSNIEGSAADRLAALWGLARLPGVDLSRWWSGRAWTENQTPVLADYKKTSYSRFSDYENCPLRYLLGQVLGLDPETTYHMAYGAVIHELLQDVETGAVPKERDALVARARELWRPEAFPEGAVSHYLWRDCLEIIDHYLAWEADNGHKTIAVEKSFEFEIAGWLVRGKIDRIDQLDRRGLRLIDYKTSRGYKTKEEAEKDLQLATYLLACVRDEELRALGDPKCAELVYLRRFYKNDFTRVPQYAMRKPDGTPWEPPIEQRITEILGGIEAEEFSPNPDADCWSCKFKSLCPMWPEGQELAAL